MTKERISKFLANYNCGSRREIERLIIKNKITVNGEKISSPVCFVDKTDQIQINGKNIEFRKNIQILKLYKPINYICSKKKQDKRKIIYEILSSKYKNFIFAGRLDINSEGLIILTNSSNITRSLEDPKYKFKRTYNVRVFGDLNLMNLKEKSKGFIYKGTKYRAFNYKVISDIKKNTWIKLDLFEGKKNEIREIFRSINLNVNKLKRVSFGPFNLNNLKPGQIEMVSNKELKFYENYIRKIQG